MKTVDKNINLSQAKKILKDYANKIVERLKSKKLRMIREENSDNLCWQRSRDKEGNAYADITIFYHKIDPNYVSVSFLVFIYYPDPRPNETDLEAIIQKKTKGKIYKKYPLTNFRIFVDAEKPKIPSLSLEPAEKVAEQLYLALKCYNKITSKIKMAQKRIDELYKKETDEIGEIIESLLSK